MAKNSGIYIKPENKGKFTAYCKQSGLGESKAVTQECISKDKASKDPAVRKRAVFAENARKWKH